MEGTLRGTGMASLLIPDVEENTLSRLRERATAHGRTPEAEAKAMLEGLLQASPAAIWDRVNTFRNRLAASGRSFGDSTELLREDRDR
jgi:plasmid stability protein